MNAPLKKLSELAGVVFDGRRTGYVPPKQLRISPKLKLHKKAHHVDAAFLWGMITLFTPSSAAKTPACAGPAPPNANNTNSRGS